MVVGDQGSLDLGADEPDVPDAGVEGEEPLDDAGPESCGDAAAVAFEAELAFQGPDDGLDALAEPVRERARLLLVFAGGRIRARLQAVAGEEFLGFLPGQALVRAGRPRPRSGKAGVRRFWPRRAGAGDVAAGLPPVRVSVRCPP